MVEIVAKNVVVAIHGKSLLDGVSVSIGVGQLVVVLGPNGAGKTTLLRTLLGLQRADSGGVFLDGQAITSVKPDQRARKVSYLPQRRPLAWPNSVRDIVALGRFAHGAALGHLGDVDRHAVVAALSACELDALAQRRVDSLSGGELARVHFARAVAADAPLLVADEPVAELDPKHQLKIADLLRAYVNAQRGALVVLHDVSLAARYADRIIWMQGGRIVADGPPLETVTVERIRDVYGVTAAIDVVDGQVDVRVKSVV